MPQTQCTTCPAFIYYPPDMDRPAYCHPCRVAGKVPYLETSEETFIRSPVLQPTVGVAPPPLAPALQKAKDAAALGDQSQKADGGKERWTLFPFRAFRWVVRVLEYGARRYSPGGWRKVDNAVERYSNAAQRHLAEYLEGRYWDLCDEHPTQDARPADCKKCSGLPHLAHLGCNVGFLLELDAPERH